MYAFSDTNILAAASATRTANFTVVKEDIALSGVGEDGDEMALPAVEYVADDNGRICVPDSLGGTNITRKVIFKGSKIDRAAPREKTKEEILMEFEERKRETRIKYEEVGRKRQAM
jgi:hypothetical protein